MRDRQEIEREMFEARQDLEANLADLKHAVREKVDVKARAKVAIEKGKMKAHDAFERGKASAKDYAQRGRKNARELWKRSEDRAHDAYLKARERPMLSILVIGVLVATVAVVLIGRDRNWWRKERVLVA